MEFNHKPRTSPIISFAILTKLVEDEGFRKVVPTTKNHVVANRYVNFCLLAGLDVWPIYSNATREEIREVLHKVNGVVLPGGMSQVIKPNEKDPTKNEYADFSKATKIIMEEAIDMNEHGIYFPVFGVCLGFEAMILVGAQDIGIVERKDNCLSYLTNLDYALNPRESKLLSFYPPDVIEYMGKTKTCGNYHEYSILPDKFKADPKLSSLYKIVATSKSKGEEFSFITIIEGIKYPFYGFQHHPEQLLKLYMPWLINQLPDCNKSFETSRILCDFMRTEAMKNDNHLEEKDLPKLMRNNEGEVVVGARGFLFHLWD